MTYYVSSGLNKSSRTTEIDIGTGFPIIPMLSASSIKQLLTSCLKKTNLVTLRNRKKGLLVVRILSSCIRVANLFFSRRLVVIWVKQEEYISFPHHFTDSFTDTYFFYWLCWSLSFPRFQQKHVRMQMWLLKLLIINKWLLWYPIHCHCTVYMHVSTDLVRQVKALGWIHRTRQQQLHKPETSNWQRSAMNDLARFCEMRRQLYQTRLPTDKSQQEHASSDLLYKLTSIHLFLQKYGMNNFFTKQFLKMDSYSHNRVFNSQAYFQATQCIRVHDILK